MIPISRANNTEYFFNERNEPKDVASEIWIQVISGLSRQEVSACFLTCKCWKKIVAEDPFLNFKKEGNYFGKAKWNKYFGDVGVEPLLPKVIYTALLKPCPFWQGKTVKETHLLVLVPETVNRKPFHLDALKTLIQKPKAGYKKKYSHYSSYGEKDFGSKSQFSHWILMTNDVIPNSRNKSYGDQKKLFDSHAKESGMLYTLPTSLEATTAILTHYVETEKYTYTDDEKGSRLTYTRCLETTAVGSFSSEGLSVTYLCFNGYCIGVGGVRKF